MDDGREWKIFDNFVLLLNAADFLKKLGKNEKPDIWTTI